MTTTVLPDTTTEVIQYRMHEANFLFVVSINQSVERRRRQAETTTTEEATTTTEEATTLVTTTETPTTTAEPLPYYLNFLTIPSVRLFLYDPRKNNENIFL